MAAWTKEKVELRFGKAKSTKIKRAKETPVSFYVAGVDDAKVLARDPRTNLEELLGRSQVSVRLVKQGLGVKAQREASYYSGACRSLAYEIQRRKHGSPERLVRWDGDDHLDLQDLRDEMRRAAYPVLELPAATA